MKFFKDNLQIGKHGLTNLLTGETFGDMCPEDIEFLDILGRGAAGYVQRGVYIPKGIPIAVKVVFDFN